MTCRGWPLIEIVSYVADVLLDGLLLVERGLQLVEVGDLQVGPLADRPALGARAGRAGGGAGSSCPSRWGR